MKGKEMFQAYEINLLLTNAERNVLLNVLKKHEVNGSIAEVNAEIEAIIENLILCIKEGKKKEFAVFN